MIDNPFEARSLGRDGDYITRKQAFELCVEVCKQLEAHQQATLTKALEAIETGFRGELQALVQGFENRIQAMETKLNGAANGQG